MNINPKISAVLVTRNRPAFFKRALQSILNQSYRNFEVIIVDNGDEFRVEDIVQQFHDNRIKYIKNPVNNGCSGGKNTGIKNSRGNYIAFLDDDDEWLFNKLEEQIGKLEATPDDVAFSFTSLVGVYDDREETTSVPDGIDNYLERAFNNFHGFLSSTLMIKRSAFNEVGLLSEKLPSHTDIDLVIRLAKKYKGLGINKPLTRLNLSQNYEHMATNLNKRIEGREMLFNKYKDDFKKRPKIYAKHLFRLAIYYRDNNQFNQAKDTFKKVFKNKFSIRSLAHYFSMFWGGFLYKKFFCKDKKIKEEIYRQAKSIDGWLTKKEGVLLYNLARGIFGKGVVVEIGSWKGRSTVWLASALQNNKKGVVYAVDPHTGAAEHKKRYGDVWTYEVFLKNIKKVGVEKFVKPLVKTSERAAEVIKEPIELIFIDGDHDYNMVKKDFFLWHPKVIEGGWMAFHDTKGRYGPTKVVKEYLYKSRSFKNIKRIDSITIAQTSKPLLSNLIINYIKLYINQFKILHILLPRYIFSKKRLFFRK